MRPLTLLSFSNFSCSIDISVMKSILNMLTGGLFIDIVATPLKEDKFNEKYLTCIGMCKTFNHTIINKSQVIEIRHQKPSSNGRASQLS